MITFKQFLAEAPTKKVPTYSVLQVEKAIQLLNERCSDAIWMLEENRPIYRGDDGDEVWDTMTKTGFMSVDPSKTERKSQNTRNYYTLILGNSPLMKDFPLRSRSFICSTSDETAEAFGSTVMSVIPYNGVKIGTCPSSDFWSNHVNLLDTTEGIELMNDKWASLAARLRLNLERWSDWNVLSSLLKKRDTAAMDALSSVFVIDKIPKPVLDDFLGTVFKAYSPQSLKLKSETTKTLPHRLIDREVWVGGPVVLISQEMWTKMRQALKDK